MQRKSQKAKKKNDQKLRKHNLTHKKRKVEPQKPTAGNEKIVIMNEHYSKKNIVKQFDKMHFAILNYLNFCVIRRTYKLENIFINTIK